MAEALTGVWQETRWSQSIDLHVSGAGLQEHTKANTKPRCPSKRTKVEARQTFNKIKSTVKQNVLPGFSYDSRVTVIKSIM